MEKRNPNSPIPEKKRKSQPRRSFPQGFRDSSPGVILGFDFGDDFAYVKRAVSCSSSFNNSSSSGSSEVSTVPNSPFSMESEGSDQLDSVDSRKRTRAIASSSASTSTRVSTRSKSVKR
jgi:hypothetical protein